MPTGKNLKNKPGFPGRSYLELRFERVIHNYRLPQPVREYQFYRWRFDFAWPKLKIFVEIDGATFIGGAHVRGKGYQRDCKKNNRAQLEGWVVLRADREMVGQREFALTVQKTIVRRINLHRNNKLP